MNHDDLSDGSPPRMGALSPSDPEPGVAMSCHAVPFDSSVWDATIRQYPSKTIFHESCWFEHTRSIHPSARVVCLELRDGGTVVGNIAGLLLRRGLISVFGSPFPGTGTNFLGPLLHDPAQVPAAMTALHAWCREAGVHHLEIAHPWLDQFGADDLGLTAHRSVTHTVKINAGENAAWDGLKGTCRNRIRKAEKQGLVCELTSDPSIVEHFHAQYIEVYAKQGLALPFGVERGRSLYHALHPAHRVLPMWVRRGDEIMAAGLFPFDDGAIYFWGAASWLRYQQHCPNELLHWSVMKEAIARGIQTYNMCGGTSQFKDKFGGSDVPYIRYSRSYLPGLKFARQAYEWTHHSRVRIRGWWLARRVAPPGELGGESD